jgi:pimeloyl-ACP methyl ester carboxylesterase
VRIGIAAGVIAGLVALGIGLSVRNPEKGPLDSAARSHAPGRFVVLGDGMTHYDVGGPDSGQRVVLVHGFSTPYYIWDSTFAALTAAGFRVARYDEFGRGYSDRPDVEYSLELFDRQLLQFLDSLHWTDRVDVAGLSMGGPVVAGFAGRYPNRVRSLVLVDPAAGDDDGLPWYFRMPLLGPWLWQTVAIPTMAAGQLSDFYEPAKWPDWPARYRVAMQYRGFGRALRSTSLAMERVRLDTLYARIGTLGIPTLLVWGKEDRTVPIKEAEGVKRAIPQVRFEPIERAGHLPHMERTDVVNPLVIAFLRGSGTAPPATSGR